MLQRWVPVLLLLAIGLVLCASTVWEGVQTPLPTAVSAPPLTPEELESAFWGALNRDPKELKRLISLGADPDWQNEQGFDFYGDFCMEVKAPRALHMAAYRDNAYSVRVLLEGGADVNGKNPDGLTALHLATIFGCVDAARELLKAGADPDLGDLEGKTPLHFVWYDEHHAVLPLLFEYGADPNVPDNMGNTPLFE